MVRYTVVPAAGEGTRLRPLTDDRPKPLVEVAGRPVLAHVLDALDPIDPEQHVVVLGRGGDAIRERFGDRYRGTPIAYVRQPEPCGLADAVGRAAPVVDGSFIVCNGDNVFSGDLGGLAAAHEAGAAAPETAAAPPEAPEADRGAPGAADRRPAATLLVEETTREAARTTGVVVTGPDGSVERVVEKPADPPSTLVHAGALAAELVLFEACDAIEPSGRGEYELPDALTWLLERGHRIGTYRHRGERVNVNEPADIRRAERLVGSE